MKTCSSVWHLISNIIKADANYIVAPAKGHEKKIEVTSRTFGSGNIFLFKKEQKEKESLILGQRFLNLNSNLRTCYQVQKLWNTHYIPQTIQ